MSKTAHTEEFNRIEKEILAEYDSMGASNRRNSIPKLIGTGLNTLDLIIPPLADYLAFRLFYTPTNPKVTEAEEKLREKASVTYRLVAGDKKVAVFEWGDGPVLLMVHGWGSRATRHGTLIDAMVTAGYKVIAFDLPGHGLSTGQTTDLWELFQIIGSIISDSGGAHAIVTHSFGGLAASHALKKGVDVKRAAFIAMPSLMPGLLHNFCRALSLKDRLRQKIDKRMDEHFSFLGADYRQQFSAFHEAHKITIPVLLVHDEGDQDIAILESEIFVDKLPQGELLKTTGLGHNKILRDKEVLGKIKAFLASS